MTQAPYAVGNSAVVNAHSTSLRWIHMRHADPGTGSNRLVRRAINLWWIALAAAEETAQGLALAPPVLALFTGHLSVLDAVWLRWRDDLAQSAEMRRAYSALYGRFFARGLLQRSLALRDFVPLHTQLTVTAAARVERLVAGDIPDWLAWDPIAGTYVLCEAKGNLTGSTSTFRTGTPACVLNGKDQFDRVEVTDLAGTPLAFNGWVGASLWATDTRNRQPVFLAFDPNRPGRRLEPNERYLHGDALHRCWLDSLAAGFEEPCLGRDAGRPSFGVRVTVPATPDAWPAKPPMRRTPRSVERVEDVVDAHSPRPHTGLYLPALLTPFGFRPLRGPGARSMLLEAQEAAHSGRHPAWFVGLNRRATRGGFQGLEPWSSEHGVVGRDGLAVFDLRHLKIGAQIGV